jgi:DNA-binding NarL/FixJ family response regulator
VCCVMRYACTIAYPDIRHYMRQNINRLVAHSNRVTACLALHQACVLEEEIAHRLRWQVPSVRFYIRESYSKLGDLTQRAVAGAALTT